MSHRVINGLSVHSYGNVNNQPVIFIHGFPFDYTMWMNQLNALKDDYYCIAYDVRGLGDSYVGDGQYTMEFFVEDLFSIINEMKLQNPVLCGLSMGGYIALRAVEREPKNFGGLILMDTKAEADSDEAKLNRGNGINKINTDGLSAYVDGSVPGLFAEETPKNMKELYELVLDKCKTHNPVGVKGCLLAMISRTDTTKSLKKIKIPTLVLAGSFDKITPPTIMRPMSEKIKDSEFGIVPRAGHLSPLENPSFVNDMLKGYLSKRKTK